MANKYYILKCFTKGLKEKTVSGQLPPGFLHAPPHPWKLPLRINAPQTVAPVENCPQEKMLPEIYMEASIPVWDLKLRPLNSEKSEN